jgi:hypothetical protein
VWWLASTAARAVLAASRAGRAANERLGDEFALPAVIGDLGRVERDECELR